jgi:hypothetical protein
MLYLAAMVTNFSMSGWSLVALVAWSCWSPARPAPQKNSEKCVAPVNRSMIATATRPTCLQEESRLIPSQPTTRRTRNEISRTHKGAMCVLPAVKARLLLASTYYSRLTRSRYSSVKSAVSAAAIYVKAAAVRTRLVPPASWPERMP